MERSDSGGDPTPGGAPTNHATTSHAPTSHAPTSHAPRSDEPTGAAFDRLVADEKRRVRELADRIDARRASGRSLRPLLRTVRRTWIATEMPSECLDDWQRIWDAVREDRHSTAVMTWRDRCHFASLPTRITVHRGCGAGGEHGWSWTLDRSVAVDFAHRYDAEPRVCTVEIDRGSALAYLRLGGEHEVVLDPRLLDWDTVRAGAPSARSGEAGDPPER